jgi:hypothetical protein
MNEDTGDELVFGVWSSPDEKALIGAIAGMDRGLRALLAEHVQDYGQVLSMLYLADVVRWADQQFGIGDRTSVEALFQLLEDRYDHGDRYVRELIGVGFVESLDVSHRAGLATLLRPSLASEYNQQNGYSVT